MSEFEARLLKRKDNGDFMDHCHSNPLGDKLHVAYVLPDTLIICVKETDGSEATIALLKPAIDALIMLLVNPENRQHS